MPYILKLHTIYTCIYNMPCKEITIYCYLITLCLPPTIEITYVLITSILWGLCSDYAMLTCWLTGKMLYKKTFRISRYCYWPYYIWMCSQHAGQACDCFYTYANLSGFLIICLDLVLMNPLSCKIVLSSIVAFAFCFLCSLFVTALLFSSSHASPSWLWLGCCSYCPLWLSLLFVCALTCAVGVLLILFNMSASGSVLVQCHFVALYCRYVSTVIDVGFMYHLLHVIHLPFDVSCIVYDLSWWLWLPVSTIIPWVHGPLSSHLMATGDPVGVNAKTGEASLLFWIWCLLQLVHYFDGGMLTTLLAWCSDGCRTFWTYLKWNLYQHLTSTCMVCHILQIWSLLWWWGFLLTNPPASLLLGTCCGSLPCINSYY